jgi:hypothetical protein
VRETGRLSGRDETGRSVSRVKHLKTGHLRTKSITKIFKFFTATVKKIYKCKQFTKFCSQATNSMCHSSSENLTVAQLLKS